MTGMRCSLRKENDILQRLKSNVTCISDGKTLNNVTVTVRGTESASMFVLSVMIMRGWGNT